MEGSTVVGPKRLLAHFPGRDGCVCGAIRLRHTKPAKDVDMPRPPNYGQERKDRDRLKAAKKAEKQAAKEAAKERLKPAAETKPQTAE